MTRDLVKGIGQNLGLKRRERAYLRAQTFQVTRSKTATKKVQRYFIIIVVNFKSNHGQLEPFCLCDPQTRSSSMKRLASCPDTAVTPPLSLLNTVQKKPAFTLRWGAGPWKGAEIFGHKQDPAICTTQITLV